MQNLSNMVYHEFVRDISSAQADVWWSRYDIEETEITVKPLARRFFGRNIAAFANIGIVDSVEYIVLLDREIFEPLSFVRRFGFSNQGTFSMSVW